MKTNQQLLGKGNDDFLFIRMLPNIFTTMGMCIGITGIRYGIEQDWKSAVICILIAAFFDLIDGLSARILKVTSQVGAELDSLSDAVSFGVTPAVILYLWLSSITGSENYYLMGWYWIPFVFYSSCCVLRLARFNVLSRSKNNVTTKNNNFFVGVPSPAGAIMLLAPIIFEINFRRFGYDNTEIFKPLVISAWVMLVSSLMVSRIPTMSLKSINYRISNRKAIFVFVGVILSVAIILREQWLSLAVAILLYLFSLPLYVIHLRK